MQLRPPATKTGAKKMKSLKIAKELEKVLFDLKFYNQQLETAKRNKKFFNRKISDALTEKRRLEIKQKEYSEGKGLDKFFKK